MAMTPSSTVADQWLISLAHASDYDEILSCGVRTPSVS